MFFDSKDFKVMEAGVQLTWASQNLHMQNLANIETPGYKTKSVQFDKVLRDAQEASGGDVAISVTQSKEKFFKYEWFKPGTILVPIGSYQECDDDCILKADYIVVDHVGQTLHRGALSGLAEKGKITEKSLHGTIGEVLAGKKPLPEPNKRVLCVPIGTGALDVAVATVVYNKAKEKGLGETYDFV